MKKKNNKYSMDKKNEVLKLKAPPPENKVLQFPKDRIVHPENVNKSPTFDEVIDLLFSMKSNTKVTETLERLVPELVEKLTSEGIDVTKVDTLKESSFFVEAFRAMLNKHHGIAHPFQQLADMLWEYKDGELLNCPAKRVMLNLIKEKK